MELSSDGIVGVFDRAADTYDAVGVPWFGPIAQGLVEELDVQPGERVVDLGCGRGAALLPMARAAGPTGRALGLDLAPRMVELTANDALDLPSVEVRVADVSAPALALAAYDVMACCLVLFFLPDPAKVVRDWVSSLVPGGRMGITTFGMPDLGWRAAEAVFEPYLPEAVRALRASGPFSSDEGVEAMLRGAGLIEVRTAFVAAGGTETAPSTYSTTTGDSCCSWPAAQSQAPSWAASRSA